MSSLTCYASPYQSGTSQYAWQDCYSAPNNADFNAPAKMADGRLWSQWSPDALVNERIQREQGIQSNWSYRQYLQQNGQQIMQYNTQEACATLGVNPHYDTSSTPSSNVPHRFRGVFDTSKPGVGYCQSDLKTPYLTREQLNARLIAPSIRP